MLKPQIINNFSLREYNSFGFDVRARYFCRVDSHAQLEMLLRIFASKTAGPIDCGPETPLLILGGGSNLVLTEDFPGLVVQMNICGRYIVEDSDTYTVVELGAGEDWHQCVRWCLDQKLYGIENLALIPGSAGAAPIQNIGAYGVELADVFDSLSAVDITTGEILRFDNAACGFGYRDSVFKGRLRDKFIIAKVRLKLRKQPSVNQDYAALKDELVSLSGDGLSVQAIGPEQVFQAVCAIRRRKLPDPRSLGNAGSFFKNPVVSAQHYRKLLAAFPEVKAYHQADGSVKLAAAWLIDYCGWRGFRDGEVGVYEKQALVLVNYGGGTGGRILELARQIRQSVIERFGVSLEVEPQVYPASSMLAG